MIDPCEFANSQLRDLIPYEPGKPIEDVARELGLDPDNVIKLASNENPLGPSPKAIEAMRSFASDVHVYPDGGGWKLRNAIAEKFSLTMENIVLGNGSNEIIEFVGHSFLKPGDQVIVAEHAFVVYKLMATLFGAETVEVKDPDFIHDLDAMAASINDKTKQIFIANPNNPTGTLVAQEKIDNFEISGVFMSTILWYLFSIGQFWQTSASRDQPSHRQDRSIHLGLFQDHTNDKQQCPIDEGHCNAEIYPSLGSA